MSAFKINGEHDAGGEEDRHVGTGREGRTREKESAAGEKGRGKERKETKDCHEGRSARRDEDENL